MLITVVICRRCPNKSFLNFLSIYFYTNIPNLTVVRNMNTFASSAQSNNNNEFCTKHTNFFRIAGAFVVCCVSVTRRADRRAVRKVQSLLLCTRGALAADKSVASGVSALRIICWCENVWRRRGNEHQQMSVHVATKAGGQKGSAPGNRGGELRPLDSNIKSKRKTLSMFSLSFTLAATAERLFTLNAHLEDATQAVQGHEWFFSLFRI